MMLIQNPNRQNSCMKRGVLRLSLRTHLLHRRPSPLQKYKTRMEPPKMSETVIYVNSEPDFSKLSEWAVACHKTGFYESFLPEPNWKRVREIYMQPEFHEEGEEAYRGLGCAIAYGACAMEAGEGDLETIQAGVRDMEVIFIVSYITSSPQVNLHRHWIKHGKVLRSAPIGAEASRASRHFGFHSILVCKHRQWSKSIMHGQMLWWDKDWRQVSIQHNPVIQ